MRLIDGSLLLKAMRMVQKECEKDGQEVGGESILFAEAYDSACDMVKSAPTVDPYNHGDWLPVDEKEDAFDCSECDAMVSKRMNFCPKCGAKMDLNIKEDR